MSVVAIYLLLQTHLTFGHEFTTAVEMKQVAQQEAERARYVVERVSHLSVFCHKLFSLSMLVRF